MPSLIRNLQRTLFNYDPAFQDTYHDVYARQITEEYLKRIQTHLREYLGEQPLSVLDACCQTGRFLIPLAQAGHRISGMENSSFALRRAARYAKEAQVAVTLYKGQVGQLRNWIAPNSMDAVLCLEFLHQIHEYDRAITLLAETLKLQGWLFVTHRPMVYYLATAVRRGQRHLVSSLIERSEGPSPDGAYHNWQTQAQLEALYTQLNLKRVACHPIHVTELDLDLAGVQDTRALKLLEPLRHRGTFFRVPSFWLVIAQRNAG